MVYFYIFQSKIDTSPCLNVSDFFYFSTSIVWFSRIPIFSPTFTDIINLCGEKEGTLPISTIPFRLLTKFQQQELYFLKVNKSSIDNKKWQIQCRLFSIERFSHEIPGKSWDNDWRKLLRCSGWWTSHDVTGYENEKTQLVLLKWQAI